MNEFLVMLANSISFVGIMAFLITVIFFTFGKYIEKQIVINNLDYLINDTIGDLPKTLKPELKKSITDSLNSSYEKININKDEVEQVVNSNKSLQNKAFIFSSILLVVSLIISFIISKKANINYFMVLFQSLLLALGVGLIEVLFMYFVSSSYIVADPSQTKKILLEKLFN